MNYYRAKLRIITSSGSYPRQGGTVYRLSKSLPGVTILPFYQSLGGRK